MSSIFCAAAANASILTLKNGDRITGKVSSANDAQMILETQFGSITIPRSEISAISDDANSPTVSQTVAAEPVPAPEASAASSASAEGDITAPPAVEKEPQWITDYRNFVKENFPSRSTAHSTPKKSGT